MSLLDDPTIKMRAQMDQLAEMMRSTAPVWKAYYLTLLDEGLPEDLAKELTVRVHDFWWQKVMRPHDAK